MNGYEFLAANPFLTVILAIIAGTTITSCVKYMFMGIRGETSEQADQEKEG